MLEHFKGYSTTKLLLQYPLGIPFSPSLKKDLRTELLFQTRLQSFPRRISLYVCLPFNSTGYGLAPHSLL